MIELKNFSKKYSHYEEFSVEDVSFICPEGEITGLVGENGSGKSTIIKAAAGIHCGSSGSVYISDREGNRINAFENPEKIKKITGYVPEIPLLPVSMKVKDFLDFAVSLYFDSKNIKVNKEVLVQKAVEKFSLENVLDNKIKTLSKGFRQRISFAQSLLTNPSVLVLDEPFSGLDPAQIIAVRNILLEEAKNKTVLISTHNLSEVHNLCNKILVLKDGHLVAQGSEEELLLSTSSKSFEEAFLKL